MEISRTLGLLRHADAELSGSLSDKARRLSRKGQQDSRALGQWMAKNGCVPDFILCSPAIRTRETLTGLLHSFDQPPVDYPDSLYNGPAGTLYEWIRNVEDRHQNILVIAHNPGIHNLLRILVGSGSPEHLNRLMRGYSSGTLSILDCGKHGWGELEPGENDLQHFVSPEDYNKTESPVMSA